MLGDAGTVTTGGVVKAEIVAQTKGDKVIVFKKRRRHNYPSQTVIASSSTVLKHHRITPAKVKHHGT